jgi:CRP/FNR family transcriptional regulator, cyclic AMP receptor protein
MANPELLAQIPLFAQLTPQELGGLAVLLQQHRYASGEVVFHQGDAGAALYIIESGEVKIVLQSPEGKETVLVLLGPGDFFGELALLDGEPRSADAVATAASALLILRREDFARYVTEQPRMTVSLLAALSRRLRRTTLLVHDAAFLDVRTRLLKVLLHLGETRGQPGPRGVVIASRLTQGDIANMVGTTRESVNKWLRYYAGQGLLEHTRGRLVLRNVERLRADLY